MKQIYQYIMIPLMQQMSPEAGVALGFGMLMAIIIAVLLFSVIALLLFVLWIWMLIDCVKREFKDDMEKVVWILLMVFLGALASIIYYFVVYRETKRRRKS
ncbi:hypothetical protein GF345_03385 [Candidatus Woesearchaeota archaeon]|nr:hypothetical protein [Candidatus Woesearchaeota archaeon]